MYIGLDLGTSGLKAILIDENQRVLAEASAPLTVSRLHEGWSEQAPFDRIMVTAAAEDDPKRLLTQLKPNGVLVAPVGKGPVQSLRRYAGDGNGGFKVEALCDVRFVPLLDGVARDQ